MTSPLDTNETALLANCYTNSLKLAVDHRCNSIAFPNISTGVYRFPKAEAAKIAVAATRKFLAENVHQIEKVIFVCFDEVSERLILREVERVKE